MSRKSNLNIQIAKNIALERGGECLSTEYKDNKTNLHWKCINNHTWWAPLAGIKNSGTWCSICNNHNTKDIAYCQKIAESRNGNCLSTEYKNNKTKLLWECQNKHTWLAKLNSIARGGWCPECHGYLNENICRAYFETIFDNKFPKTRPKWLKSKNSQLELDGYCEDLKIAFEHQGEQHYIENVFSNSKLDVIQERDSAKRELCKNNGVVLIEIPALNFYTKMKDLEKLIFSELEKNGIVLAITRPLNINKSLIEYNDELSYLRKMEKTAFDKRGKLLSDRYTGSHAQYWWECEFEHKWECKGYSVVNLGSWCPECYGNRRSKIMSIPIMCIETGIIFESTKKASEEMNILGSHICLVLKSKAKTAKGFTFKYYVPDSP